jgi:hypothetical protein
MSNNNLSLTVALVLGALACGDSAGTGSGGAGGATSANAVASTAASMSNTSSVTSANGPTSTSGQASASASTSGVGGGSGQSYTTLFPLTENPISESGHWMNGGANGLDWHDVSSTPGLAIGHQSGSSYTDGTALLTGTWSPDQTVEATVHTKNQNDPCYQEVEIRLRSTLSAHVCNGYEISFKASKTSSAYLIIVRWNGAVGDFTYLQQYNGSQYGVSDGDSVKASIVGNVITAYINNVQVGTATDDTYTTGSPGMGFNLETGDAACIGTNGDYGFTKYSAEAH